MYYKKRHYCTNFVGKKKIRSTGSKINFRKNMNKQNIVLFHKAIDVLLTWSRGTPALLAIIILAIAPQILSNVPV